MLKILARITRPTRGRVEIFGQVGSLLEVGTGFHQELTGRENVYLNRTILGMKKKEIDNKFDVIVQFSGVEDFLDTPVKRYSSGMQVRLAFSVAAHLEPEIWECWRFGVNGVGWRRAHECERLRSALFLEESKTAY